MERSPTSGSRWAASRRNHGARDGPKRPCRRGRMSKLQNAIVGGVRAVLSQVPAGWLPGGTPDPLIDKRVTLGTQQSRVDGPDKVCGAARFAAEVPMEGLLYAALVHSTIARGRIADLDTSAAEAAPGVQ